MKQCIYKTRMSLFNLDVILWGIISVILSFINIYLFMLSFVVLIFWVLFIVGTRICLYEDKIEYRVGFILKTSVSTIFIKNISFVNCSQDLLGKIFHYGDIIIATYNEKYSFTIKRMKNAKMLIDNIYIKLDSFITSPTYYYLLKY